MHAHRHTPPPRTPPRAPRAHRTRTARAPPRAPTRTARACRHAALATGGAADLKRLRRMSPMHSSTRPSWSTSRPLHPVNRSSDASIRSPRRPQPAETAEMTKVKVRFTPARP